MAITISTPTLKDVQWLANHPRGEGMVVSCYSDTSVSSGVRPLWREHLKNEVRRIDDTLADAPAVRAELHRNIAAIETVLASRRPVSTRGMAVFASSQQGFLRSFTLASPIPDRLVVNKEPYLVPLLELLHRQHRYLVAHTDTHHGRLYTVVPGSVRLIGEISEEVPKRQRASGERWGKQQATIARHREDRILHYLKDLAREIERTSTATPASSLPSERSSAFAVFELSPMMSSFGSRSTGPMLTSPPTPPARSHYGRAFPRAFRQPSTTAT